MDWLIENKEWLFSGVLIVLPLTLIGWFVGKRILAISQQQKGGHNSTNIQAGGDVNIGRGTSDERSDSKGR